MMKVLLNSCFILLLKDRCDCLIISHVYKDTTFSVIHFFENLYNNCSTILVSLKFLLIPDETDEVKWF